MYALIGIPFVAAAGLVWLLFARRRPRPLLTTALSLLTVLILTAVFDNLMIWAGLVDYGASQSSGLRIGLVPVEDFLYSLVVVLVVTALWNGNRDAKD